MDPAVAMETLTRAMLQPISVGRRCFTLMDATDQDLDAVRKASSRSGNITMAKKTLKVNELLEELLMTLDKSGAPDAPHLGHPTEITTAPPAAQHEQITTLALRRPPTSKSGPRVVALNTVPRCSWSAELLPTPWAIHSVIIWRISKVMIIWGPILACYFLLFGVVIAVVSFVGNPRTVVRLLFAVIDSAPTVFSFIVDQIIDEFKTQIASRIR